MVERLHVRRLVGDVLLVERRRSGEGVLPVEPVVLLRGRQRRAVTAVADHRLGVVRRVVGEPEEPRLRRVGGVDELLRVPRDDVGGVVGSRRAERLPLAVVGHHVVVVARRLEEAEPRVVPGRRLRPLVDREVVEELAVETRLVARTLQPHGQHVALPVEAGVAGVVGEDVVVVRVLAGDDAGAIGAAQGRRREPGGELRPVVDDPAKRLRHVRRPERVHGLVVDQDEQDVGRRHHPRSRAAARKGEDAGRDRQERERGRHEARLARRAHAVAFSHAHRSYSHAPRPVVPEQLRRAARRWASWSWVVA